MKTLKQLLRHLTEPERVALGHRIKEDGIIAGEYVQEGRNQVRTYYGVSHQRIITLAKVMLE